MARFLALDWDQNQLHVISAEVGKGTVRVKRARVWQESQTPNPATAEDLGKLLRDRLKEAGISPAPVLACVGRDRMIVKEIRFPSVPESEEPAVVRFQAVKELTDAAEDVVIDYVVTGGQPGGEQKAAALVVRKELLDAYRGLCDAAGLKLAAVAPRIMGVAACLRKVMGTTVITPYPSPRDGVIAVVNVGEKFAEFSILRGETFLLTRSMSNTATMASEIRRNLAVHAGQMPHLPVVGVYLTGHGAGELRAKLTDVIEQPVYTFDPFAWAETIDLGEDAPSKARGAGAPPISLLQEQDAPRLGVGTRGTFAGAMGLLFLKAASNELAVNFVSPRQPKAAANPNYRLIRLALVAGIALFVGLVVLGRVLHAQWTSDLAAVEADNRNLDKQLFETKANAKRLKELDDWDSVVWLDELYNLNALIPSVNTLRVTQISAEPLPRNPKSRAVAKATLKGKLLDRRNPREPLDKLVTALRQDGYYSPEAPKVENDHFTLVVTIERRAPADYTSVVKEEKAAPRMRFTMPSKKSDDSASEDDETEKGGVAKGPPGNDKAGEEKGGRSKFGGMGKSSGKSKRR